MDANRVGASFELPYGACIADENIPAKAAEEGGFGHSNLMALRFANGHRECGGQFKRGPAEKVVDPDGLIDLHAVNGFGMVGGSAHGNTEKWREGQADDQAKKQGFHGGCNYSAVYKRAGA